MDDSEVLGWLSDQAAGGSRVFSVCTGALLLGAAGTTPAIARHACTP